MADDHTVLAVLTTIDSAERAEALAAGAVRERLAACAQVSAPITSYYQWQDTVQQDQEWQVLFKTPTARYPELERYLRDVHDYDVPEIIATPVVHGSADYLSWVTSETLPAAERGAD